MAPDQETTQPDHKIDLELWNAFKKRCSEYDEKQFCEFPYWICNGDCEPFTGILDNHSLIEGASKVYPAIIHSTDIQLAMFDAMGKDNWLLSNSAFSILDVLEVDNTATYDNPYEALKAILLKVEGDV